MNNDINSDPCPQNNPHLDLGLLRTAVGPGLQVSVGEQLLRFLSEPEVCRS